MPEDGSLRPLRDIARELGRETNAERILALCDELTSAMQAQGKKTEQAVPSAVHRFKPKPTDK
jgi:prophage antirepressor-like protein